MKGFCCLEKGQFRLSGQFALSGAIQAVWDSPCCLGQFRLLVVQCNPVGMGQSRPSGTIRDQTETSAVVNVNGCPVGMEVKSGRLKPQCNLDRACFVLCCRKHLSQAGRVNLH